MSHVVLITGIKNGNFIIKDSGPKDRRIKEIPINRLTYYQGQVCALDKEHAIGDKEQFTKEKLEKETKDRKTELQYHLKKARKTNQPGHLDWLIDWFYKPDAGDINFDHFEKEWLMLDTGFSLQFKKRK